jgi:hyperosmotically inducible protein
MKISSKSLPAVLCAAFLAVGAGAKESHKPDAWITTKVKSELAGHKNVSAMGTHVETRNGTVILRGEVKSAAEKELAETYAKQVDGVRAVDNRLTIKGSGRTTDGGEMEGAGDRTLDKLSGKTERGSRKVDRKIEGAGDRAVDTMGNAGLTGRVKAALAGHRGTSAFRTDVDSDRGAVTLTGTAKSEAEKDLAEKVVRGVKGVKEVDNRIQVR